MAAQSQVDSGRRDDARLPPDADAIAAEAVYCPHCGYDLRTLTGAACPECGGAIDHEALRRSQIPWTYRKEIGRFRALRQTVWRVTFRTKKFCWEISRPADLADAKRFRLTVVWLVYAALLPLVLLALLTVSDDWAPGDPWLFEIGWIILAGMLWVFLYAITGVHTYWFHPRALPVERQNRAMALSYYACAPLALFPIAAVIGYIGLLLLLIGSEIVSRLIAIAGAIFYLLGGALLLLILVGFWRVCIRMAGILAERGISGQLVMAITLPMLWLLLTGLCFILLPGIVGYVWLIFYTL